MCCLSFFLFNNDQHVGIHVVGYVLMNLGEVLLNLGTIFLNSIKDSNNILKRQSHLCLTNDQELCF